MKKIVFLMVMTFLLVAKSHAEDRRVLLVNNSSSKICEFYASNTNRKGWEEDILGQDMLRSGQQVNINLDDGSGNCWFDFKTVLCDGRAVMREGVNVCKVGTYTLNDD